jgi:serine/threonine-protein kinase
MYSMGCLYYYALTGLHPFNGETGQEVMDAHLQHRIFPLREMRPDIPRWAVDWVMWHMNRLPEHRPQSAREALQVFLLNDRLASTEPEEEEEQNKPFVPPKLTRPKRPSDSPPIAEDQSPPVTVPLLKTAPQPILPPSGAPSLHGDGPLTSPLGIIGSPLTATQAHQLAETLAPPLDRKITDATSAQRRMHVTSAQTVREAAQPAQVVPEQSPSGQLVPTGQAHVSKPVVPLHTAQQHAMTWEILARKKLQQKKKRAMIGLGAGLLLLVIVLVLVLISSGKR